MLKEEVKDDSIEGFFGHSDSVYSVKLNPVDPTQVVLEEVMKSPTFGADWIENSHCQVGGKDSVVSASWCFDGKLLATASMDYDSNITVQSSFLRSLRSGRRNRVDEMAPIKGYAILRVACLDGTCWLLMLQGRCLAGFLWPFGFL